MQISTRSRYGVRAMAALSRAGGEPLSCEAIAESEGISKKYLDRILGTLRTAELVESYRGKGGGYCLARAPEEIRLSEIVSLLEEGISIIPCLDDPSKCEKGGSCSARDIWEKVTAAIEKELEDVTLADLAECAR